MQQHREVEDHREREPGDVLRARRGPGCACSMRGATRTAIRPATTNHVDDTRTSLPASVPIRKVPGGRGAGDDAGSDTLANLPVGPLSVRRPTLGTHERGRTRVPRSCGSLSPSRAADFLSCPLMFRFRTVDRLPEPSSPDARARAPSCTRSWRTSSTCRPPSGPASRRTPCSLPAWDRAARPRSRGRPTILEGLDEDAVAGLRAGGRRPLVRARGPHPARARRARGVRRVPARLRADAARRDRPDRRGAGRRDQSGGLQERAEPCRGLRGPGAVPAEVLRV